MRWAFEELVTIENSTGDPEESSSRPAWFQENPADFSSCRAASTERWGCGSALLTHNLFPGPTFPHNGAPRVP